MCGINCIVSGNKESSISLLNSTIAHRGPDDSGSYVDDHVQLGHLRLAIQDLSQLGHQPMFSADGDYIIVFNGEIYNHQEIRNGLIDKYSFKSTGDTETLLYAFIEYGVSVLEQLNGIFAFIIYQRSTGDLWAVRDHFGVKPLYIYQKEGVLGLSSEIKALIQIPGFDNSIDYPAISNYMSYLYSPGEKTSFQYVKKIKPGYYIKTNVKDTNVTQEYKYYEIPFDGVYFKDSEKVLTGRLDEALNQAVERQLLSDVPVGSFLSGGLDSSLLVAIASKIKGKGSIPCFTINTDVSSNKEGFVDDLPYAIKVADYLGAELNIVNADINIIKDIEKIVYHLDEPLADPAPFNVYNICQMAREKGIYVLLSGAGGDDLFSGYRRHQALYYISKMNWMPKYLMNTLYEFSKEYSNNNVLMRRLKKFLTFYETTDSTIQEQLANLYLWISRSNLEQLFHSSVKDKVNDNNPVDILLNSLSNIPNEHSLLNQMLFWEIKYFLSDHNLTYTDKMSMAHGVEVRVPYLDKDLVDLSTKIPPHFKLKGTETKYLLRKVAENYLPKEIVYRSKTGFGAPIRDWVTNDLYLKTLELFDSQSNHQKQIFDCNKVTDLIKKNKNNEIDASYIIWALLTISTWSNLFIHETNHPKS